MSREDNSRTRDRKANRCITSVLCPTMVFSSDLKLCNVRLKLPFYRQRNRRDGNRLILYIDHYQRKSKVYQMAACCALSSKNEERPVERALPRLQKNTHRGMYACKLTLCFILFSGFFPVPIPLTSFVCSMPPLFPPIVVNTLCPSRRGFFYKTKIRFVLLCHHDCNCHSPPKWWEHRRRRRSRKPD